MLWLYVDYKGLNVITVKNYYPLSFINKIIDRVQEVQFFSKIDLKDIYYRIKIHPKDEQKTVFRTRYRYYEFLIISIRFTNAPTTFQIYINQTLKSLIDDFYIVYWDDILIFSKIKKKYTKHLQEICWRLKKHKLYIKPSKCSFYQKEIEFLRFIINVKGIQIDFKKVQTFVE